MTLESLQAILNAPGRKLTVHYLGVSGKFFAVISRSGKRESAAAGASLEAAVTNALYNVTAPCQARNGWTFDAVRDDGCEVQYDEETAVFVNDAEARRHITTCKSCRAALVAEARGINIETLLQVVR